MHNSSQTNARMDRLESLTTALAQLNSRIRAESADVATAMALRARFLPSLTALDETRAVIIAQLGRGRVSNETLLTLYGALGELAEALTSPLPDLPVVQLSRHADRRARQRAEQLDNRARKMLGAISSALAAGSSAAVLIATPVAASMSTNAAATSFAVQNMDVALAAKTAVPVVSKKDQASNGSGGGAWSDGDNGNNSANLTVNVTDVDHTIIATGQPGILVSTRAGYGGSGGGAGLGGSGGDGGWGGAGGTITLDALIDIVTNGDDSHGIVAISAGGGGGNGGDFAVGVGSAGDGGQGGRGGDVSVKLGASTIITSGSNSDGIFASSVGGPGGNAGSCDVAICGSSGGGNSAIGGTVSVYTDAGASITVNGKFSKGIRAASLGGFGGNGGDSYFAAGYASNGGSAGDGGAVTVTNNGAITTHGINSDAIYAQSVGGGGGDGGDTGISIFSLGGGGAHGGHGGSVQVTNGATGVIETWNDYSRGVLAQSIGGSGGSGGSASSLVSIGGNGSATSNGGTVNVNNAGAITTHGVGSQAIFAESIGGGGGDGGGAGGLAAVGGIGGGGGDSKTVTVGNTGSLTTLGSDASAIYAQSVGGGGGDGGGTGGMISIGGSGGDGGKGGVVDISNTGKIKTSGDRSIGVFAQSVGGGGGNGGGAASVGAFLNISVGGTGGKGGDGDLVTVKAGTGSDIRTGGERAAAIFAQSVGGGGGNGGYGVGAAVGAFGALSIAVGGSGGDGGDGKTVTVNSAGYLETIGADSQGVFAQSVGGSGGNGGFAAAAAVAGGKVAVSGAVAVGGAGAGAGDGDLVKATNSANISTTGDRSSALHAQSVGGGGGHGGWSGSIAGAGGVVAGAIGVSVGGSAGGGGAGGLVEVANTGDIGTKGEDSYGILAQSVGGGGGTGGFSVSAAVGGGKIAGGASLALGGSGGDGGDAKLVTVDSQGAILTGGDRAIGILAQSLGGGGGAGGWSGGLSVGVGQTAGSASVTVGGTGGKGGNGFMVDVDSASDIGTGGDGAHGIFAQSVGGGGGAGGFSLSGALSGGSQNSLALNASVGGSGGVGGKGDDVKVEVTGLTQTTGDGSHGVFAQSVGGGGGDGGWAGRLTGAVGANKSVTLGVSLGGQGGSGGTSGTVEVDVINEILTTGEASHGVFAQSVGGGGGTGGFTIAANLGATKAVNIGLALGGSGGGAGMAGDVYVTTTKTINTKGDGSIGVFAQSVGGGGGSGGSAGNIAMSGSQSVNVTASMGGFGGNGALGGYVVVDNSGSIWTTGELAHGIQAQSIGGGGGHGGVTGLDKDEFADYAFGGSGSVSFGDRSQNISIAMGGSGGKGNHGGEVKVVNSGAMRTDGAQSNVIFAQSVGGGGGDGGIATSMSGAVGAGKNGVYSIAMGGFGGVAGNGGEVMVQNSGLLLSNADGSHGVMAQSVGGGGGAGGDARGFALAFSNKKSKGATSVSVSLGGYGGAAGDGGEVTVDNDGAILTLGARSFGVMAQSVGGGGGAGGSVSDEGEEIPNILDLINKGEGKAAQIAIGGTGAAAGDGGFVRVLNDGVIHTKGEGSHAIFAQSVGGGGGLGGSGLAGEVSVGGQGAAAGDGGEVYVVNKGAIVTEGDMARGVYAQSIGGGGGVGGATDAESEDKERGGYEATMATVGNLTATAEFAKSLQEPAFGIGIGGMGGAAGNGGKVTVLNEGKIETFGVSANGIFAQSVGGGGGQGGEGIMAAVGQVVFSGLGGSAGDGGEVIVTNKGDIVTHGAGATGIFAQSVGGGGGLAGDYSLGLASWGNTTSYGGQNYSDILDLQLNPVHANGGDGGDVTVTNTGNITVTGPGAMGIFAQSVGGGGGLFGGKLLLGFFGSMEGVGEGGKVTVVQNGNVIVGGKNGIGAVFQSASKDGNDDITVTLNGDVKGGSVYGMGVLMDGGKNNTLTLNGVTWSDSKLAVTATGGNDAVISNKGLVGNVDLGLGVNSVINNSKSFFVSLDYVKLNGGDLINHGLLSPGDAGTVQTTSVQGNFIQSATGNMLTDLDLLRTGKSGEIDQLKLTGSIDVKGAFTLNILNPGYALPGSHTVAILDGSGTLTQSNLTLNKPISAVASFALAPTAQDLNLKYDIDFSPIGLNRNQTALGDHINAIQTAGSSPTFAPITAELFYVPTVGQLANIYDGFSPETYAAQQTAQIFASQQFADSMFSCPRASEGIAFSDRGCIWVKPSARWLQLKGSSAAMAYDENSTGLAGGFEAAIDDNWRVGGALSAEDVGGGVKSRVNADGQRFQGGVVVKRDPGQGFGVGLALHGGQSDVKTRRLVPLPASPARLARGKQDMSFLAATARATYRWGSDRAYVKPIVEASAVKVETKGFTETGAGAVNLVVPDQKDTYARASFKVEAGAEFRGRSAVYRPYGRVGATYSSDAEKALFEAAFQGAPAAAASGFTVNPGLDKTTFDTELGLSIIGSKASGRLAWTGQFGDRTRNQTLSLKLAIPF
ncbi:autotransporter outer membrane beta-barrel domain-containing protein [Caulobacter sp.]|uniref:autotransporter outer membrane beta-barrel domain-containing protein n=1 Tax=Caulobacter sp. TaxID=78 RepID=UPI001B03484E|nr:autotransporter outer membrane beta-barrel domain-containing protein [Caulobacter sp.]MBO9544588.1 hypothetical protein [Caulobacter sp.]